MNVINKIKKYKKAIYCIFEYYKQNLPYLSSNFKYHKQKCVYLLPRKPNCYLISYTCTLLIL